jgi:nitric oxide reductase NorQ protein
VLVTAAHLIVAGATELEAAEACILAPLSSDGAISEGLREVAAASLADADNPSAPR